MGASPVVPYGLPYAPPLKLRVTEPEPAKKPATLAV